MLFYFEEKCILNNVIKYRKSREYIIIIIKTIKIAQLKNVYNQLNII